MGTRAALIALGQRLKAAGYQVSENPAFGGVSPVHVPGSAHYTGDAFDLNYDGRGQAFEDAKLNAVVPLAHAAGLRIIWQSAGHFDHMHLDDKPGPDIGNIVPGTTSTPAPSSTSVTPAGFTSPLDTAGTTITHAVIIGLAVISGAGLVLLGLTKAAGNPAGKLLRTITP